MGCWENLLGRGTRRTQLSPNEQPDQVQVNNSSSSYRPTIIRSGSNNAEIAQSALNNNPQQAPIQPHDNNSNLTRYTNEDFPESIETFSLPLELSLSQLKQRIEEISNAYTTALTQFLGSYYNNPDANLEQFHAQQKHSSVAALQTFAKNAFQSPSMAVMVKQATEVLVARIDNIYAENVNSADQNVLGNYLLKFSNSAAEIYTNHMQQSNGMTRNIQMNHEGAQQEAMAYFQQYFQLFGWNFADDWKQGLLEKINTKLQRLQASQELQHSQHEGPLTISPANKSSTINIGIYLSESIISIATVKSDSQSNELIEEMSADISFFKDEIKIGRQNSEDPSFKLHALIKQHSSIKSFQVGSQSFKLSAEEILEAFFIQLRGRIGKIVGADINKTVLTVSFFLSALEKERIKYVMKIAGFEKLRIVTSVLTTAVAYAHEIQHYEKEEESKLILVIHPTSKTFSMAMIELCPNQIVSISAIGPENIPQYEGNFVRCHKKLYNDQDLSPEQMDYIKIIYEQALNRLFQDTQGRSRYIIMVKDHDEIPHLEKFLKSFFNCNIINMSAYDGPLAGAALVACELPILPSHLKVYDCSLSNLVLSCDRRQIAGVKAFRNSRFVPGEVFSVPVAIPSEGANYNLQELVRESVCLNVGRYNLLTRNGFTTNAKLVCQVDQDGIFTVHADFPNGLKEGYMKRTFGLSAQSGDNLGGLKKLYAFYDQLSKGKERDSNRYQNLPILNNPEETVNVEKIVRTNVDGSSLQETEKLPTAQTMTFPTNPDVMTLIKHKLQTAKQEGLNQYKKMMTEVTDRKEPLKDSDIKRFHDDVKNQVSLAFLSTFENILCILPDTKEAVQDALQKLQGEMRSHLPIFLKRHEIVMERVAKTIALLMLEAGNNHEDKMEEGTSPESVKESQHRKLVAEAETWLKLKLEEEGIACEEYMLKELLFCLNKTFQ